jgi:DDE superfamily endonuclease
VLYDAKRHSHTAQGLAISTIHGDLLWCDGGWPGNCHEHELIELSGLGEVLDAAGVASLLDRGFRGLAKDRVHWHAPVGDRRTRDRLTDAQGRSTACKRGSARWWSSQSPIWQAPGRCVAGAGCCIGLGTSSGPRAR